MKIYLNNNAMQHVGEIDKLLQYEQDYNCSLNGMEYEIVPDEHTWIEGVDEINGTMLLDKIINLLETLEGQDVNA